MFFLFEQQKVGLFVFSKVKWFESSSFKGKLYLKSSIKSFKKKFAAARVKIFSSPAFREYLFSPYLTLTFPSLIKTN